MPSSLVTTLEYTYAVQGDLERRVSPLGVKWRIDHDNDGPLSADDLQGLTDCIVEATETINFYCFNKYTPAMMATSNMVNRWCTILAVYRLCTLRLNPPPESIVEDAADVEEKLKEIRDKSAMIPGLPLRRILAPVMSHTRLVPRYDFAPIRVERKNSSQHNQTVLRQNVDYQEAYTIDGPR